MLPLWPCPPTSNRAAEQPVALWHIRTLAMISANDSRYMTNVHSQLHYVVVCKNRGSGNGSCIILPVCPGWHWWSKQSVDEATLLEKPPPIFRHRSRATILWCVRSELRHMARCPIASEAALLSVFQARSLQGWPSRITSHGRSRNTRPAFRLPSPCRSPDC